MNESMLSDINAVVEFDDVGFKYGRKPALVGVSFELPLGVHGLLGLNGSGKTTLLSILATLARPGTGVVRVVGSNVAGAKGRDQARTQIGFLPQSFKVLNLATVAENVAYAAWAHGVDAKQVPDHVGWALARVGLEEKSTEKVRTLSGGQRQRLGIACAVAHRPSLVLLDELTVGVDPIQRGGIRNLIEELGADSTVLMSTHLVDDIARVAQILIVLDNGRVAYFGTTSEFAEGASGTTDRADAIEAAFTKLVENS